MEATLAQPQPSRPEPALLGVDASRGLRSEEAAARLARYGPNLLASERRRWGWLGSLRALADPMVVLLLGASAIFFALGEHRDGTIMLVAVLPVLLVDLILEGRAERALERLRELTSPRALVRRDGRESWISGRQIVPGDVVLLNAGDVVPADGVVHSESNLQVDESALTGESLPVSKAGVGWPALGPALENPEARLYAGTTLLAGRATMVVTATGSRTEYGRIGTLVEQAGAPTTPLQRAIAGLIPPLTVVAVAASLAVVGVELARGSGWVAALLAGVSLAIAAIPEEFPVVFALYLTLGAWRMARRNALVRRLAGVETLGSTTVICTDKTGTLTRGSLSAAGLYEGHQLHLGPHPPGTPAVHLLLEDALLASEPNPFDPLDQAIAALAAEAGLDPQEVHSRWRMVRDYPFDPSRKYVTHVWRSPEGELRVCSKGSVEGILEASRRPQREREELLEANRRLTGLGMRVIAVAATRVSLTEGERWADEAGMEPVGLLGFADPLRPEVKPAVAECQAAGVRVIVITGDHPLTAHVVAEAAGIRLGDDSLLTGVQVEQMSDEELNQAVGGTAIFARTLPAQKYRIVKSLQAQHQVVAMTGDGINDAPALRAADIGVAMGRRGTQVAREAATMVLLDDNFGTIVEAIQQGRRIFDNLRRAFLYLIGFHIPIVLAALLAPLVGAPLLLLPVHLVWLELIVHPTSALVFESDPPDPDLMRRPPRDPAEPFLPPRPGLRTVAEGVAILLGTLGLYLAVLAKGTPVGEARAVGIGVLIVAQNLLVLQTRSPIQPIWRRGILDNRVLLPILLGTLASLGILVYVGPLASATQLAPPSPALWAAAIGVAMISTLSFEVPKLL